MTYEEALNLKSFKHRCNCGGFAWGMNGREAREPHMQWCPQAIEYKEWYNAINKIEVIK